MSEPTPDTNVAGAEPPVKSKSKMYWLNEAELWNIIRIGNKVVRLQMALDALPDTDYPEQVKDALDKAHCMALTELVVKIGKTQEG